MFRHINNLPKSHRFHVAVHFKGDVKMWEQQLLYSWRFSRYGAPIHWLVHGHTTSNNETVSRQMP